MARRGVLVVMLAALSGVVVLGCRRTAVVSPEMRIAPPPQQPPSISSVPRPADRPAPPALAIPPVGNPWKPDVPEHDWKYIVIHHTATSRGSVESIHEAHLNRRDADGNPWLGIGYHFVIGNGNGMQDGEIEPTFRWRQQLHGAHAGAGDYNRNGIGIALVGNFEEAPPTSAQVAAVKRLVGALKSAYDISTDNVIGHSDVKSTACPGKLFPLDEVSRSTRTAALDATFRIPHPDNRLAEKEGIHKP